MTSKLSVGSAGRICDLLLLERSREVVRRLQERPPHGSAMLVVAYYADTALGRVDRWSWSPTYGLFERRPFRRMSAPDGICVDVEGGVWGASYGAGVVHCYDPDGNLCEEIDLPTTHPTAVAFTGPILDRLVITTSRIETPSSDKYAGALFIVEPGVTGAPLEEFAR